MTSKTKPTDAFVSLWNEELNLSPLERYKINRKISQTLEAEYRKFEALYKSGVKNYPTKKSLQNELWKQHLKEQERKHYANPNLPPEARYDNFKMTLYVLSSNIEQHLRHGTFKSKRAYLIHWLSGLRADSAPKRDYLEFLIDIRDQKPNGIEAAYLRLTKDLERFRALSV